MFSRVTNVPYVIWPSHKLFSVVWRCIPRCKNSVMSNIIATLYHQTLIFANYGCKIKFTMALISISLDFDVLKYLFIWLLAIYFSSLEYFVYSLSFSLFFLLYFQEPPLPMTCWEYLFSSIGIRLFYNFWALWWTGTLNFRGGNYVYHFRYI